jgi:hypothetical protein
LAPDEGAADAWALAERYAAATLPAVFKPNDPVLALPLDPFHHKRLQDLVTGLDPEVFAADDALGWTYQFWRAAEKDAVNKAGGKIGAADLPAVTQLFTEPYMVRFLLHNTLGAWWAGKVLARQPDLARDAPDEAALRAACALPGIAWEYLRFVRDPAESGPWWPAAGAYPGWPDRAAEITLLDPCCGSGHFLVEALPILAALRVAEEGLDAAEAARAVLRDNLHGLELDGRCVQIAAFAVALSAWRIAGSPLPLPNPHIAWVGAPPPLSRAEMGALAGDDMTLRRGLEALHDQFLQAPLLGSLMEPQSGDLLDSDWRGRQGEALAKLADRVLANEPERAEGAIAARGLLDAVELLSRQYILLATNVPFLGRGKQDLSLAGYIALRFPDAKADLATAMLERLNALTTEDGAIASVSPQNWLFLGSYRAMRARLLSEATLRVVAVIGEHGFESAAAAGAFTALVVSTRSRPNQAASFLGLDAHAPNNPELKSITLLSGEVSTLRQDAQKKNPDSIITLSQQTAEKTLSEVALCYAGTQSGDFPRCARVFWEISAVDEAKWRIAQGPPDGETEFSGLHYVANWPLIQTGSTGSYVRGVKAWGTQGVVYGQMRDLPVGRYLGVFFFDSALALVPHNSKNLLPVMAFAESGELARLVRTINKKVSVNNGYFGKVPFNLTRWQAEAAKRYPNGITEPCSDDPTQWIFHGHPAHAEAGTELQVAFSRLAGFRWPAESDKTVRLSTETKMLVEQASALPGVAVSGLLPLHAEGADLALADRLRLLLAAAFGSEWSNEKEAELVRAADLRFDKKFGRNSSLESWLRDRAFRQHCELFHQRPFLWQIGDGLRDGFSAFLHYHGLTHAALQKLTYEVLGNWLARAKAEGQLARAEKARALQQKLEAILEGEAPYDVFVRWKSLAQQSLGWDPDLDDGVRQNIRPFIKAGVLTHDLSKILKEKDRGTDPTSAPWYASFKGERRNDHHTTLTEKSVARAASGKRTAGVGGRA